MGEPLAYNTNLRSDIKTHAGDKPKARVHSREWEKIMNGDPVEINPSVGFGYKVLHLSLAWQKAPRRYIAKTHGRMHELKPIRHSSNRIFAPSSDNPACARTESMAWK